MTSDLTPEWLAQIRARAEKPDHVTCAAGVERRDIRALLAEITRLRDDRDRQVVAVQRLRRTVVDLDAEVERLRVAEGDAARHRLAIPDAAIRAGADALSGGHNDCRCDGDGSLCARCVDLATTAIRAALPYLGDEPSTEVDRPHAQLYEDMMASTALRIENGELARQIGLVRHNCTCGAVAWAVKEES